MGSRQEYIPILAALFMRRTFMHSTIAAPELSMQFSHDYVLLEMSAQGDGDVLDLQLNHCDF